MKKITKKLNKYNVCSLPLYLLSNIYTPFNVYVKYGRYFTYQEKTGGAAMKKTKVIYNNKKYTVPALYMKLLPVGIVTGITILATGAWLIVSYMLAL